MGEVFHVLLTRFNVGLYSGSKRRDGSGKVPSQAPNNWFQHRVKLFERFCLPSVGSQTNCDFQWWLLIDEETPDEHRRILSKYANDQIKLVETTSRRPITIPTEDLPGDTGWVLTTRIDNDDAMHSEFMSDVRDAVDFRDKTAINVWCGLSYNDEYGTAKVSNHDKNMFMSYLCDVNSDLDPRDDYRGGPWSVPESKDIVPTVLCQKHNAFKTKAHHYTNIRRDKPRWMLVHHDRNLNNRSRDVMKTWEKVTNGSGLLSGFHVEEKKDE